MRFHEKLHCKGLEREDGGIESYAERDDVPIADPKLEEVGEDDVIGRGFAEVEVFLGTHFEYPIDDRAHNAKRGEAEGNQKRRAPVGISGARPSGRVQRGERSQAADGKVDAEGKAELFAFEPAGERGGDRDV